MQPTQELQIGHAGIRKYLKDARIGDGSTQISSFPKDLKDLLYDMVNPTERSNLSYYAFDSEFDNGWINVLGEYSGWLMPHVSPNLFTKITFDKREAAYFEYRVFTIAYHLYGDPNLFYIIYLFNDIQHPADLSKDYLMTEGIYVLNIAGIDALRKVLTFKNRKEATFDDDTPAFEDSDF